MSKKRVSIMGVLSALAVGITIFGFVTGVLSLPQLFATTGTHGTSTNQAAYTPLPGQPTPISTRVSTATPLPHAGTVLYSADWSNGPNGWANSDGQWNVANGMLLCSGSDSNVDAYIAAPYSLPTANYEIETSILLIRSNVNGGYGAFGPVARVQGSSDSGYQIQISADKNLIELTKDFQFDPYGTDPSFPNILAAYPG